METETKGITILKNYVLLQSQIRTMKLSNADLSLTDRQNKILEFHLNSVDEINEFTIDIIEDGLYKDFFYKRIKNYEEYLKIRTAFCDAVLNYFK